MGQDNAVDDDKYAGQTLIAARSLVVDIGSHKLDGMAVALRA